MPVVPVNSKYKKIWEAYWKRWVDNVTGKKPFKKPNYHICVPMNPKYAKMLERLDRKVHPEYYGN